jgi:hypothetical protein
MAFSKNHEDWIIANVARVRVGNHRFSDRGVQLFMERLHRIKEQREMRKQKIDLQKQLEDKGCNCAIRFGASGEFYSNFIVDFRKHMFDNTIHAKNCRYRNTNTVNRNIAR